MKHKLQLNSLLGQCQQVKYTVGGSSKSHHHGDCILKGLGEGKGPMNSQGRRKGAERKGKLEEPTFLVMMSLVCICVSSKAKTCSTTATHCPLFLSVSLLSRVTAAPEAVPGGGWSIEMRRKKCSLTRQGHPKSFD